MININIIETDIVKKIMSSIIEERDFNKMSGLVSRNKDAVNVVNKFLFPNNAIEGATGFISIRKPCLKPFNKVLSEKEFYKIVGKTKKGISARSGKMQEWLYGHYIEALNLHDEGYISDTLYQALEFNTNLHYVKTLMKNKSFVKAWREDFGDESALEVFKRKGNLRIINIVKERAKITTE